MIETNVSTPMKRRRPLLPTSVESRRTAVIVVAASAVSVAVYAALAGSPGRLAQLLAGSWVTVVIVAAALAGAGLTIDQLRRLSRQTLWTRWVSEEALPAVVGSELPVGAAIHARQRIDSIRAELPSDVAQDNLLVHRTLELLDILDRGGHPAGAGAAARELADLDRERFTSSVDLVGLLVWAVPILGFIGTVLGISMAVDSFSGMLTALRGSSAIGAQMQPALAGVTSGLAVAFDTTLLGLLFSIPLLFANSAVRTRAAQHLDLVDESVLSTVLPALTRAAAGRPGRDTPSEAALLADQLRALQAVVRDLSEGIISTPEGEAASGSGNGAGRPAAADKPGAL